MKFLFLCNQQNPKCCNSYFCGVECFQTTDVTYSAVSPSLPLSYDDLEDRFEYVGEFIIDGTRQTVWEEKERSVYKIS